MDEQTKDKLRAIYESPVKRWIVETVIDALLFWQRVREVIGNGPPEGGAPA